MSFIYREGSAKYWVDVVSDATVSKTRTVQLTIRKVLRSAGGKSPPVAGDTLTASKDVTAQAQPWDLTATAIPAAVITKG